MISDDNEGVQVNIRFPVGDVAAHDCGEGDEGEEGAAG